MQVSNKKRCKFTGTYSLQTQAMNNHGHPSPYFQNPEVKKISGMPSVTDENNQHKVKFC